jgi:hypothetical protein
VRRIPPTPPLPAEKWSPYEVGLFESAICLVGKMFPQIAAIIKTKTAAECVEFYYVWKKSSHYPLWKATYRHQYGDIEL